MIVVSVVGGRKAHWYRHGAGTVSQLLDRRQCFRVRQSSADAHGNGVASISSAIALAALFANELSASGASC
jgi:hypothetical protein